MKKLSVALLLAGSLLVGAVGVVHAAGKPAHQACFYGTVAISSTAAVQTPAYPQWSDLCSN